MKITKPFIVVSGKMGKEKAMVNNFGLMANYMKENGVITWQMVMVDTYTLMEIITKETGLMIKQMEKECIFTLKERDMKEIGLMIFKTVLVLKLGKTVLYTKEIM